MLNYGKNKEMTKRPDKEPSFSLKNKFDKKIILVILISLLVIASLTTILILCYTLGWFK